MHVFSKTVPEFALKNVPRIRTVWMAVRSPRNLCTAINAVSVFVPTVKTSAGCLETRALFPALSSLHSSLKNEYVLPFPLLFDETLGR